MKEMWLWFLCQEDLPEKEMATHCRVLSWEIPWTEEPGGLQFMGLKMSWIWLVTKITAMKTKWKELIRWQYNMKFLFSKSNQTSSQNLSRPCYVIIQFSSVQWLSHVWVFETPMGCSMPGFPVLHQLMELMQTHVHQVGDAIQPSHPLLSPSPPAFNLSQHQSLFQWVRSLH